MLLELRTPPNSLPFFFGNRFRILGNRNSPFALLLQTFAMGNNSVSRNA